MEAIKFETDIKCAGCIAKVSPHLNEAFGENHWEVDTSSPLKVLIVRGETSEAQVEKAVGKAGFKARRF